MSNLKEMQRKLKEPFYPDDIEWRVSRAMQTQKGNKAIVLAYVTNRAIMNRLDEVFGIGNWKNEYKEWRDKGVLCGISAKIGEEWVTKWDGSEETNIEATKGGFSGSMKRAAVQWGIGRYLYNLDEVWVEIKERGENFINTKVKDQWIKGYWDTPLLPNWALPTLKLDDVLAQWKEQGSTEAKFDDYIKKQFSVTRDTITQSQLAGIKKRLDMSRGS
ncbi:Rad52/Rad22 family DNA repair protein [Halalkalibacterium halodurans]|uniref:Rad52/Rad22 family DNA repair protein n=1 Tax=Halalkalibacterium halodurans TaxID=86665 RepID=UPI002E1E056C|nr:Rad52/Rad22 family DNA repair protein [Halalkalibacterium halodurans]MED4105544.1 Rad52/Rad22 family DNA repair protein [Halalkalibacterium halodurans]MED4109250.1 Rad52/Rad22 family DNA repair protein [Halalkalibacterium halodurans]MED4149736.1 Rad52/Rad22 family DNA repair protein [Halalkalibacterium halodurans]